MAKKDIEIELQLLATPTESDLSMAEQMSNKKSYEKQIDSLCIQSDEMIRDMKFDEGLFKLLEAYKIVSDHPWSIKQSQIYDLIQNAQNKRQDFLKKAQIRILQQKERQKEEKKQVELIQSHKLKELKKKQEKETKLQHLADLKQKEEEISNKAYKILGEGQVFLKNQQYNEVIAKYNEAKKLFLQIKWNGEAKKLEDSIHDFEKKKQLIIQKQEKEGFLREKQEKEWKNKEQQLVQQTKQDPSVEEEKRRKRQESYSRKELENQVYAILDEASKYERSGEISKAIQSYENAKSLMERLGWKQEVSKLNDSISVLLNKVKSQVDVQKRELLSKQAREREEQDLQRKIKEQQNEQQKQENKKQRLLRDKEEKKEREKFTSEKAFQEIEVIEKEVKYYKEHVKIDKFEIECPYLRAKGIYENSKNLLISIGWKGEAEKLISSITMYDSLYQQDLKERVIFNKRKELEIEEQRTLEESIHRQQEEQERADRQKKAKLLARGKKKEHITEISQNAFNQIEEIEKKVKYYKENAVPKNYTLDSPFLEARDVYKNSRELLLSIGWTEEADKLLVSISMHEHLHLKDQKERATLLLIGKKQEIEELELENTIRLQREEHEKKEKERIQKLQNQGKRKEYEKEASKRAFTRIEEIEKEVKYYKDHAIESKYNLDCPYLQAIEVYKVSRNDLLQIGWKKEANKLLTSIAAYEQLYQKDKIEREKLILLARKKQVEESQLEEVIRQQKLEKEREEQERLRVLQEQGQKKQQEDEISKAIFQKIEEIEKQVKFYKEHVLAEHYVLQCPYLEAKEVYKQSREQLLNIGWKEEADKLRTSISLYEKLANNDVKEREKFLKKQQKDIKEQQKFEESIRLKKEEQEKEERERLRILREQNKLKQHEKEISEEAFQKIEHIEKEVVYYKERVKVENYSLPCPYQRAVEVYQQSRDLLLGIGWKKEADKLGHSISLYTKSVKEDLDIRAKFAIRLEKEKQAEQELKETIRKERERLSQEEAKIQSEKAERDQKKRESEELQQQAYNKLEEGNTFIQEKDFENATERLNEALKIFKKIKWKNGVKLTEDAIRYKDNEREKFEKLLKHERMSLQEQKRKEREFQEFIEEQRRLKEQEEQNRKLELLRIDMEGKKIGEKQELAFKKLEEGNDLCKIREFTKANTNYLEALKIFKEIGWIDGVEKTKEAISHNTLEQERYNQQQNLKKKQEKEREKEERELTELIKQRQALTQLEEEQKRLKFEQQHELAEKIKRRQQEASSLLEKGNTLITQHDYDAADKLFKQALSIFKEIKWDHGIKIANDVLKHCAEERMRFEQIIQHQENARQEQIRQQQELEKMLIDQKLMTEQEAQLKQLKQQEESNKISQIQSMQDEAMSYLEKGNHEITKRNFDEARKLFSVAMKIFQNMGWNKGIEMVNTAIDYNEKELVKFTNEKLREEQKKKEAELRQQEINKMIKESKEEEVKKQLEWKKKLEDKTRRLDEENQIKDQIFALLEKGSTLAAKNEFLSAIDLYKKTIPFFEKISWPLKRDQVIDLIDTTQQEYDDYRSHLAKEDALRKRQIQEEEELQLLIAEDQKKEAERQASNKKRQLKQMQQDKLSEDLRKEASDEINKASVMLERRKFENAIDSLNIALENFKKLGWTKEAQTTEEQITEVQRQKREAYKPVDREKSASDMQVSENGYAKIDEADKLIRQKKFKEALPFLEEAKLLFEKIKWTKAIKMVEIRIRENGRQLKQKDELIEKLRARKSRKTEKEAYRLLENVDRFRRENHYDYALTSAVEAQKIFADLGWEREANEGISLIDTIKKEIQDQNQSREKDHGIRQEKIKIEEEEERKIQEIIEERRRRRREAREKLKQD